MLRFLCCLFLSPFVFSQNDFLPKKITIQEAAEMDDFLSNFEVSSDVITSPPNFPIRTMAEWEEIQALTIAWEGFPYILLEIVRNAVEECNVIIACESDSEGEVYDFLSDNGVNTSNVYFLNVETNSIWMRDYGQNTIYSNDVDSLFLVDWIYNRPRPADDMYPEFLADYLNLDLYQTSVAPYNIVSTGGNFMSDGFGTAFSSNLILNENDGNGPYNSLNYPEHTEPEINSIMNSFMGIETYIKMPTLEFDGINHIDMHMKLLDEETLLVSEYPDSLSDGPQIEQNLDYILSNFTTKWGTPFNVIRIPAPPSSSGAYPGVQPEYNNQIDGYYRTYTNSVFVNKTVILPFYREEYDTIAQRIYEEALPGYNIVGIDVDNNNNNLISQSGAIHCITHSVGVNDPLLISYKKIEDTCPASNPVILFESFIKHRSGINQVFFNYRYDGIDSFISLEMENQGNGIWAINLDFDYDAEVIEYYIHAVANSGKNQYRPMTALNGGVYSFSYSLNQCDGTECAPYDNGDPCFASIVENQEVCGCDGETYATYEIAICNNIYYWTDGPCETNTEINTLQHHPRSLIKLLDFSGKEIKSLKNTKMIISIFDDGTVEKHYINN